MAPPQETNGRRKGLPSQKARNGIKNLDDWGLLSVSHEHVISQEEEYQYKGLQSIYRSTETDKISKALKKLRETALVAVQILSILSLHKVQETH